MKYRVVMLPQSIEDAVAICDYLAERNPSSGDRFFRGLEETLELQASMPTPGMPWISENSITSGLRWTRVKGFGNYLIFFRISSTTIDVTRVLHGARNLDNLLG